MVDVRIGTGAEADLRLGFEFYESQASGLGRYFLGSLIAEIDALAFFAGMHPKPLAGLYRSLARRFPFAIYYDFDGSTALVLAVLDCRRNPRSIRAALAARRQP
ncbi:MAG: type II toxin-antitoxin system RelE/ParE family toxin [Thiobacillus sp.]|nr:type II toxin-antitoxin system RelE/ParE family toxin [Thiobacillus sp.]